MEGLAFARTRWRGRGFVPPEDYRPAYVAQDTDRLMPASARRSAPDLQQGRNRAAMTFHKGGECGVQGRCASRLGVRRFQVSGALRRVPRRARGSAGSVSPIASTIGQHVDCAGTVALRTVGHGRAGRPRPASEAFLLLQQLHDDSCACSPPRRNRLHRGRARSTLEVAQHFGREGSPGVAPILVARLTSSITAATRASSRSSRPGLQVVPGTGPASPAAVQGGTST